MEVYALVGSSGTGKSHRAAVVANNIGARIIIDDGLLIENNRIIAGTSAKRQPTKLGAIKAALFMDDEKAEEIIRMLGQVNQDKLLLLGTSEGMVRRIAARLGMPPPMRIIRIEEIASEKEIRKARFHRNKFSKHVIPAPIMEVKRSLPGILVDPLHVFLRKKEKTGKKDWVEQSIIRPTRTFYGKLLIADSAIKAIVRLTAGQMEGVTDTGRIGIKVEQEGTISIDISPVISYGCPLQAVACGLQSRVKTIVEKMTGLQVKEVNVKVKSLSFAQRPAVTTQS